ncbi:GAP family protein [Candidatus Leptofilum sp.]|uniref:GAP family protein n=1 Tax=Candidatus Leptofilum sp. TaxID=3241576 RepID=UPI003B5B680B
MLTVLIQSLVLAAGGMLSVGSITIVILLLLSDRGWQNGLAYVLGYVGAYSLIGTVVVWVGFSVAENGSSESGNVSSILLIIMGLLLLWLTQRNWRKPPPENKNSESPRLFALVDKMTPPKAFGFGALVTVINFKNLAIFLSAVSVPLLSNLSLPAKIMVALLDALVFCTAVIVPVLIYVAFPKQANERLNWIKQTLERYGRPIGIGVPLLFGLIFLIRGITGLL